MEGLFNTTKQKYIQLKGQASFEKLYAKIERSDALTELCGASVRRGMPPTSGDFIYKASMMPSIYFTFDNAKSSMAALIMLKIWDDRVNSVYNLASYENVIRMARCIISESMYLRSL